MSGETPKEVVINKWDVGSLKLALDDAAKENVFFTGLKEDKTGVDPADTWTVCSYMNKYDPTYHFSLKVCDGISKKVKMSTIEKSAAEFFNVKGELQRDRYNEFLQHLVSDLYGDKKSQ
ncbi:unnamed protein product [Trichobilharzia regenti]|nr:unnamed protein product [Trichobilharzia regenti]